MSADKPRRPSDKSPAAGERTLVLRSSGDGMSARSGTMRGRGRSTVEVEIKRSRSAKPSGAGGLSSRINLGKSLSKKSPPQTDRVEASRKQAATPEENSEAQRLKVVVRAEKLEEMKAQKSRDAAMATELEAARRQREEFDRQAEEESAQSQLTALEVAQREVQERSKATAEHAAEVKVTEKPSGVSGRSVAQKQREEQEEKAQRQARDKKVRATRGEEGRRRQGKLTISQALRADGEPFNRGRSVAALKRQRDKERARAKIQRDRNEMVVREVVLPETISVGDLANRMAVRGAELIKALFSNGMVMKLTDILDADTAELMVQEFGHHVRRVSESDVESGLLDDDDQSYDAQPRSPVVTVMGHVDHGKTTLLDTLRKARVAAGEAGGITQHVAAYQVEVKKTQTVTFLDTPGHAAFSAMRSRGAEVTDIVVLIVAANDGVLPQTIEAINHARAASVPIIVAINKCDLDEANPQQVRNELLGHDLVGEENGGDTLMVEISALNGDGIEDLLEAVLLQAELLELSAVVEGRAKGVVIEARQEKGRGVVATVLVQAGRLSKGDTFVAGHEWGRVKMLHNDKGQVVSSVGPSTPVELQGFQGVARAGDELIVVAEETTARNVAEYRQRKMNETRLASLSRNSVDQMFKDISSRQSKELNILLRADVLGSQEAISQALHKISTDEVTVKVVHSGIGAITESDIALSKSSNALVVGFNVRANAPARDMARREGIGIRYFSIIYELIDDVRGLAEGLLAPEEREEFLGYAEIREVFHLNKIGNIAGCVVTEGVVRRGAEVRLLRNEVVVHRGRLSQLKRFKDDVNEVRSGTECGMAFENYGDITVGDRIECFVLVKEKRTL